MSTDTERILRCVTVVTQDLETVWVIVFDNPVIKISSTPTNAFYVLMASPVDVVNYQEGYFSFPATSTLTPIVFNNLFSELMSARRIDYLEFLLVFLSINNIIGFHKVCTSLTTGMFRFGRLGSASVTHTRFMRFLAALFAIFQSMFLVFLITSMINTFLIFWAHSTLRWNCIIEVLVYQYNTEHCDDYHIVSEHG